MFRYLLYCLLTFAASNGYGQTIKPVRYRDEVFSKLVIQKNISYLNVPNDHAKKNAYLFDLYEPSGDSILQRPLIIWLHGGGFKFGSKKAKGVQLWSKMFGMRGYVSAGLNYPLSKKNPLLKFAELKKGCYEAVQAVEEAVAFFKKNAALYRIDTSHIIVAGNSAGGIIALQMAYTGSLQLAGYAGLPGAETFSAKPNPAGIAAVVNFWGGIFKIDWLQNGRVPIFSAYGSKDKLVAPGHKNTDTAMYGSMAIHEAATKKNIPNSVKVYEGYSHELQKHFNPLFPVSAKTRDRWRDAGQSAADFLYEELFKNKIVLK